MMKKMAVCMLMALILALPLAACNNRTSPSSSPLPEDGSNGSEQARLYPATLYIKNIDTGDFDLTQVQLECTPESKNFCMVQKIAQELNSDVRIQQVYMQGSGMVIDFAAGGPPTINLGSSQEAALLDSIAKTVLENLKDVDAVFYRVDNGPYSSGHFYFDLADAYTLSSDAPVLDEVAQQFNDAMEKATFEKLGGDYWYDLYPIQNDETAKKITQYLYKITWQAVPDTEFNSLKDADPAYLTLMTLFNTPRTMYPECFPETNPVVQNVCDLLQTTVFMREADVQETYRSLFGKTAPEFPHLNVSMFSWREGYQVYSVKSMGFGGGEVPILLSYEKNGNTVTAEVAFIYLAASSGNVFSGPGGDLIYQYDPLEEDIFKTEPFIKSITDYVTSGKEEIHSFTLQEEDGNFYLTGHHLVQK